MAAWCDPSHRKELIQSSHALAFIPLLFIRLPAIRLPTVWLPSQSGLRIHPANQAVRCVSTGCGLLALVGLDVVGCNQINPSDFI